MSENQDLKIELKQMLLSTDNNPVRFASTLKNKMKLREYIDDIIPYDMKLLEKVYNIMNDDVKPFCGNNNKRSFKGFGIGYSNFCGKGDVCLCYKKSLSKNNEQFGPMCIEQFKTKIENLVDNPTQKISSHFKKGDSIDYHYLKFLTPQCKEDASISERLYAYKNPSIKTMCNEGNFFLFNSFNNGYRNFCSTTKSCVCKSNAVSAFTKEYNKSNQEDILTKQKKAFYDRHVEKARKNNIKLEFTLDEYDGIKKYYPFSCTVCNHKFTDYIYDGHTPLCKSCNPPLTNSKEQDEVFDWIKTVYDGVVISNDRTILPYGKEIDIYIPDINFGIEYNGIWYHSEQFSDTRNDKFDTADHKRKTSLANKIGLRLMMLFSDEWKNKNELVKKMILNQLGKDTDYIHARKCSIQKQKWSDIKDFIDEHHIQGSGRPSKYNYTLVNNDEIVAVMTFVKHSHGYEILRYCSKVRVNGGASKLLKYFIKEQKPNKIVTYCDRRYGSNKLYSILGFEYKYTTKQNYFWIHKTTNEKLSREKCQKHKLVEQGHDASKSEKEIMVGLGYVRLYDSGHDFYEMNFDDQI